MKHDEQEKCFKVRRRGVGGIIFCGGMGAMLIILGGGVLWGQSKRQLVAEVELLRETRDVLERQYWEYKQEVLRERERLNEKLGVVNERLQTLFARRNSLNEEVFLVQENLDNLKEAYENDLEEERTFKLGVEANITEAATSLVRGYPSELERNLVDLNRLRSRGEVLGASGVLGWVGEYLDFEEGLIRKGEEVEAYQTNILNEVTGVGEVVRVVRVGYIYGAYSGGDIGSEGNVGYLVRRGSLGGVTYEWKVDLGGELVAGVSTGVAEAYSGAGGGEQDLRIYVDAVQAGERVQTFLANKEGSIGRRFIDFFNSGGFMMYPLALLGLVALGLGVERGIYFRRYRKGRWVAAGEVVGLVARGERGAAQRLVEARGGLMALVLAGLWGQERVNRDEGESILAEGLERVRPYLEQRLATLAVLGVIAPLLGLLGTVSGMIALFDVITSLGNNNPKVLAGGISIALVTTQTGLWLAVPIILVHHMLVRYKTRLLEELELSGGDILAAWVAGGWGRKEASHVTEGAVRPPLPATAEPLADN